MIVTTPGSQPVKVNAPGVIPAGSGSLKLIWLIVAAVVFFRVSVKVEELLGAVRVSGLNDLLNDIALAIEAIIVELEKSLL